jgi:hypothetical protein
MMFIKYLENHLNHQALVCRSIKKKTKHEDNCGVSAREPFLPQAKAIAWLAEPTFLLEIPRTLMVPVVISIKFLAACIAPGISESRPYFYFCHLLLYIINFFF